MPLVRILSQPRTNRWKGRRVFDDFYLWFFFFPSSREMRHAWLVAFVSAGAPATSDNRSGSETWLPGELARTRNARLRARHKQRRYYSSGSERAGVSRQPLYEISISWIICARNTNSRYIAANWIWRVREYEIVYTLQAYDVAILILRSMIDRHGHLWLAISGSKDRFLVPWRSSQYNAWHDFSRSHHRPPAILLWISISFYAVYTL